MNTLFMITFPYHQPQLEELTEKILHEANYVIDYFPFCNANLMSSLPSYKRLAYISLYKVPRISETQERTGFKGGAPSKEELLCNPYWQTIALDNGLHATQDLTGTSYIPFGKQDYKRGWYTLCLTQEGISDKIMEGIDKLLKSNISGLFIDNVIQPKHCFAKTCDYYNQETSRQQLLQQIASILKETNKTLILNVGRKSLLEDKLPADYYVTENFIFGEKQDPTKIYFAGKYISEQELKETVNVINTNLEKQNTQLIGYTKVPRTIPLQTQKQLLLSSQEKARQLGIHWMTNLRGHQILRNNIKK